MVVDVADAAFFFAVARGHFSEIMVVKNGGPDPVEPGETPPTTVAMDNFGVVVLTKMGLKARTR